jgi:HK97 family phage portal protein
MKFLGFEITRVKAPVPATTVPSGWNYSFGMPFWGVSHSSSFPVIQEPFTGAWQRNQSTYVSTLLVFHAIYRCITLISQDISKMRIRLMEQNQTTGIWTEIDRVSPYWPVLVKPNHYQNRIQFFDEWMGSKLIHGNTYALKVRDSRGIVTNLYVLNPLRTRVKVAPDSSVYYELQTDDLAQIEEDQVTVPASEIIHDRYKPLYHPLCGLSPILACAMSGALGINIQMNSGKFFENASRPGGVLSAPEHIEDDTAKRLKEHWENNYSGANAGRIAVLGDGLKYEPMKETAVDAQLVEQLKISGENVCTAFGVPPFMIGIGQAPSYNNIEALNQQYYSQCLQNLIETIELLLDEGLGLTAVAPKVYGTEFDLSDLLRMDTATKSKTWGDLVKQSIASPNEARAAFDLPPVRGGESPMAQQQNFTLEALAKRDSKEDPFVASGAPAQSDSEGEDDSEDDDEEEFTEEDTDAARAAFADRIIQFARYQLRTSSV